MDEERGMNRNRRMASVEGDFGLRNVFKREEKGFGRVCVYGLLALNAWDE